MAYKARPILKVRFVTVRHEGQWRVLIKSYMTYKGKPVMYGPSDWWGGVPKIALSASNSTGCLTPITNLGEHNSHLMPFEDKLSADKYVERVTGQLKELMKAWPIPTKGAKIVEPAVSSPTKMKGKWKVPSVYHVPKLTALQDELSDIVLKPSDKITVKLEATGLDKSDDEVYNEKKGAKPKTAEKVVVYDDWGGWGALPGTLNISTFKMHDAPRPDRRRDRDPGEGEE